MASNFVKKYRININTNDVLLNLYGDDDVYKAFPNVGEYVEEGKPLLALRRINYGNVPYTMKIKKLQETIDGDLIYYAEGKVIDIEIFNNESLEKIEQERFNHQIYDTYLNQREFQKEFIDVVKPILDNSSNKASNELIHMYDYYSHLYDIDNVKATINGNIFDKFHIVITVEYTKDMDEGDKMSNRYGE